MSTDQFIGNSCTDKTCLPWKNENNEISCRQNNVSVLGRDKGYTVKYNPSPEGVPEGTPEGQGVYLNVYPE